MLTDRRNFLNLISLLPPGLPAAVNALTITDDPIDERNKITKKYPLYVFSKVLQWVDLDLLPFTVRRMGYDGIDLTVRTGGHIEPRDVKKFLPHVVYQSNSEGLAVPMLTTSILDANDRDTREILETASKVGIGIYRLGWYKYDIKKSIEDQIKEYTEKLSKIAELNKEYGIAAHYQNHSGPYFGATIWDLKYALKQIGAHKDVLAVQYDIRHAIVEGVKSWRQDFKSIADQIASLVVKAFYWTSNHRLEPKNVLLGDGVIDFSAYFQMLTEMKILAPVSIHLEHSLGGAELGNREPHLSEENLINAIEADRKFIGGVLFKKMEKK